MFKKGGDEMTTFYLVRHGETTWNKNGRFQGKTDIHLSPKGKEQAEKLASWFEDKEIDAIYSSSLSRAVETADPISKALHMPIHTSDELLELNFGKWEGKNFAEIESLWPGMMSQMMANPEKITPPGGESYQDCETRVVKFLREISKDRKEQSFVIVSHGAAIRTMICGLLSLPLKYIWKLSLDNTSITCITSANDFNVLRFLNCMP
jgi:alpha-ribazole phosphatase